MPPSRTTAAVIELKLWVTVHQPMPTLDSAATSNAPFAKAPQNRVWPTHQLMIRSKSGVTSVRPSSIAKHDFLVMSSLRVSPACTLTRTPLFSLFRNHPDRLNPLLINRPEALLRHSFI